MHDPCKIKGGGGGGDGGGEDVTYMYMHES